MLIISGLISKLLRIYEISKIEQIEIRPDVNRPGNDAQYDPRTNQA